MNKDFIKIFHITIGVILLVAEGMNYSIVAPFYPIEAHEKATSATMVGIIVGSFTFSSCVFAFGVTKIISSKLKFFFFNSGSLIGAVSMICLGMLKFSSPGVPFYVMSIFCRVFSGLGASFLWSSAYPAISSIKTEWVAVLAPLVSLSVGFGTIIGPPIGSLIYNFGGYAITFFVIGGFEVVLSLIFMLISFLCNDNVHANEEDVKIQLKSIFRLTINYNMIIISLPLTATVSMLGLIDTVLAPYLVNVLSMTTNNDGLVFAMQSASSGIANLLILPMPRKGYGSIIFAIGPFLISLGGLLFWLQALFDFLRSIVFVTFCLVLIAFGASAIILNGYLMYEKISLSSNIATPDNLKLIAATWQNIVYSSGGAVGAAFFGGIYYEEVGIFNSFLTIGILALVVSIMNLIVLRSLKLLRKTYFFTGKEEETPLLEGSKKHSSLVNNEMSMDPRTLSLR